MFHVQGHASRFSKEPLAAGGIFSSTLLDIFSIGRYNFYMFMFKFQLRKAAIWKK